MEPALEAFGAAGSSLRHKRHRHIALGHQIHRLQFTVIFVAVTKDRFQPVQLPFDLIRAERDTRPLFVGDDQAVSFRYVDALNLQTTLKNLRRSTDQIERRLHFVLFQRLARLAIRRVDADNQRQSKIFRCK